MDLGVAKLSKSSKSFIYTHVDTDNLIYLNKIDVSRDKVILNDNIEYYERKFSTPTFCNDNFNKHFSSLEWNQI